MRQRSPRDRELLDVSTVRALLDDQFPQWTDLPLDPQPVTGGSDHVLHRLGDDLVVRLPLRASVAAQGDKEARRLPALAPALPVPTPVPVARGRPGPGYAWSWSVKRWMQASDRGELRDDVDAEAVVDQLWGACYHRLLIPDQPLTEDLARTLVDQVVRGITGRRRA